RGGAGGDAGRAAHDAAPAPGPRGEGAARAGRSRGARRGAVVRRARGAGGGGGALARGGGGGGGGRGGGRGGDLRVPRRAPARADSSANKGRGFVEALRSLAAGDFVVHVEHGIGRYLGLVHKQVGANTVDLLTVEYAGGDKLYLPVYRLNQIQKYAGGEGAPKLDRLGGQTFAKTKAKVQKNLRKMADELLRLYAERRAATGGARPPGEAGDPAVGAA